MHTNCSPAERLNDENCCKDDLGGDAHWNKEPRVSGVSKHGEGWLEGRKHFFAEVS